MKELGLGNPSKPNSGSGCGDGQEEERRKEKGPLGVAPIKRKQSLIGYI